MLLTVVEAARQLGLKESTIRAYILKRAIGYTKVGKKAVRIPMSEIQRIKQTGFVPARAQQVERGR